ncbi:MAG: hypothetical protein WC319_09450 [Candidatus Paceibacterota bacterium]
MNELRPDIARIFRFKSFITGGCIPSMAMGEFVNDYDIYLLDKESVDKVKAYFSGVLDEVDPDFFPSWKINLITDNAINLNNKIQIITKYYGQPEKLIDNFDWAHIKSYYTGGILHLCPDFYQYIVEKDLVYTGSEYPLSSLLRTRKFIKKGWHVSTKTMVHITLDVLSKFGNNITPEDIIEFGRDVHENEFREDSIEEAYERWSIDKVSNPLHEDDYEVDADTLITQLNGVDPLTIQARLREKAGMKLTIKEILELL